MDGAIFEEEVAKDAHKLRQKVCAAKRCAEHFHVDVGDLVDMEEDTERNEAETNVAFTAEGNRTTQAKDRQSVFLERKTMNV